MKRLNATDDKGWTPKAIGAMAACVFTFLVGLASIIFYASGELDEREIEEEIRYKQEAKRGRKKLWTRISARD